MNFASDEGIRQGGFEGFKAVSTLQTSGCCEVPDERGVYLVLSRNTKRPDFLSESIGGHFKGKDPTVEVGVLKSKWIRNSVVLYIGKAGGPGKAATLRSRVRQYLHFGQGKPIGHWGGRYIWQLADSSGLEICWKPTLNEIPREVEKGLIREFKVACKKLPFANLVC